MRIRSRLERLCRLEILEHDGSSLHPLPKDTVANGDKLHLTAGSETASGILLLRGEEYSAMIILDLD